MCRRVRPQRPLVLSCILSAVAAACGGSTVTTTTGPTAVKCATSLSGLPTSVPAGGTRLQATVAAARECEWNATSEAAWVRVSPESGRGEAEVTVAIDANDSALPRTGAILVNGTRMTVSQEPAPCRSDLNRSAARVPPEGGRITVSIASLTGCGWQVSIRVPWVSTSSASGSGSGTIELIVAPNPGPPRSTTIDVAGRTITLEQLAATPGDGPPAAPAPPPAPGPEPPPLESACTFEVSPAVQRLGADQDSREIQVRTDPGCEWTASTTASWISITGRARGTGPGAVTYRVTKNNGAARTATITVGGQTVRVEQDGKD